MNFNFVIILFHVIIIHINYISTCNNIKHQHNILYRHLKIYYIEFNDFRDRKYFVTRFLPHGVANKVLRYIFFN
jgi:hypothetical protein